MSVALQTSFLTAVLGPDGAAALFKAASRQSDLAGVLVPRTILSFVQTVQALGYKGEIPGMPGSIIALTKSGGLIDRQSFTGSDANPYTMAAHLALKLGLEADRRLAKHTKNIDLGRFGKSIDLLVKSRMVRGAASKGCTHGGRTKMGEGLCKECMVKTDLPGTTAKPQLTPPDGPQAPQKQPARGTAKPSGKKQKPVVAPARTKEKVPGLKPSPTVKIPEMKISKAEALGSLCGVCNQAQFHPDGGFYGCLCFRGLAPFVTLKAEADHYTLWFGPEWDSDAREVLYETLHGVE